VPCKPRQIEFSRLNLEYTVMSKRRLTELVSEGHVAGWDDPRMPTVAGLRRRGYTPAAIRDFCERVGITKSDNLVEMALLESTIREDLDRTAPRRMAVLNPLKVVITNYPEDREESIQAHNHPKDETMGSRSIPFGREIYIDRADFAEQPPKGFKRLVPGGEVRLRNAYVIRCDEIVRDAAGEIRELRVSADLETRGRDPVGRKVKGVIHWVAAAHARRAEVRLYDRLFRVPVPGAGGADFRADINPASLRVISDAVVEPVLGEVEVGARVQFEREGYFVVDPDSTTGHPIFNLTVGLRDTWGKAHS
jgi:glutaminyl-tRNA synthetase